jgi:hypothetical protein
MVERERLEFQKTDKAFLNIETNKLYSVTELWSHVLSTHNVEAFGDVPMNHKWAQKTIETREDVRTKFRVVRDGERTKIHRLTFTATVRHRMSPMPLVEAVSYSGGDGPASVVARWVGGDERIAEITVILSKRANDADKK